MAGGIIVETARLDSTADKVESIADMYNTEYTSLFNAIQELQTAWSGKDNTAFTSQIEGFRDDFQRMEQLMREYSKYLHKAAMNYRDTQNDIESRARQLSQGS